MKADERAWSTFGDVFCARARTAQKQAKADIGTRMDTDRTRAVFPSTAGATMRSEFHAAGASALLLLAPLSPRSWWQSSTYSIGLREMSVRGQKDAVRALSELSPQWAMAGRITFALTVAAIVLIAATMLLSRLHARQSWPATLAAVASFAALLGAVAFMVLRPSLTGLQAGAGLICIFIAAPLGGLASLAFRRRATQLFSSAADNR